MEAKRKEIVDYLQDTGLVERCVRYQTNKSSNRELKNDLTQECWLWLLTYDLDKLTDAYDNGHINALITKWIRNQWHSRTSPFFKEFRKFDLSSDELTQKELDIPDDIKI